MLTAPLSRKQLHRRLGRMLQPAVQDRLLADRLGQRSRAILRKATASLLRLNRQHQQHRQRQHSLRLLQPGLRHRPRQQLNRDSRPLLPSDKIRMSGKEFI